VAQLNDGQALVTLDEQGKLMGVDDLPPAYQAKADEIARARRAYASSPLTLGLSYAQAGLLDEAERELHALHRANPNSAVVRRWLADVRATRR
jgi:hypothetical protein